MQASTYGDNLAGVTHCSTFAGGTAQLYALEQHRNWTEWTQELKMVFCTHSLLEYSTTKISPSIVQTLADSCPELASAVAEFFVIVITTCRTTSAGYRYMYIRKPEFRWNPPTSEKSQPKNVNPLIQSQIQAAYAQDEHQVIQVKYDHLSGRTDLTELPKEVYLPDGTMGKVCVGVEAVSTDTLETFTPGVVVEYVPKSPTASDGNPAGKRIGRYFGVFSMYARNNEADESKWDKLIVGFHGDNGETVPLVISPEKVHVLQKHEQKPPEPTTEELVRMHQYLMENLGCSYDGLRQQNIAENQAKLPKLQQQVSTLKKEETLPEPAGTCTTPKLQQHSTRRRSPEGSPEKPKKKAKGTELYMCQKVSAVSSTHRSSPGGGPEKSKKKSKVPLKTPKLLCAPSVRHSSRATTPPSRFDPASPGTPRTGGTGGTGGKAKRVAKSTSGVKPTKAGTTGKKVHDKANDKTNRVKMKEGKTTRANCKKGVKRSRTNREAIEVEDKPLLVNVMREIKTLSSSIVEMGKTQQRVGKEDIHTVVKEVMTKNAEKKSRQKNVKSPPRDQQRKAERNDRQLQSAWQLQAEEQKQFFNTKIEALTESLSNRLNVLDETVQARRDQVYSQDMAAHSKKLEEQCQQMREQMARNAEHTRLIIMFDQRNRREGQATPPSHSRLPDVRGKRMPSTEPDNSFHHLAVKRWTPAQVKLYLDAAGVHPDITECMREEGYSGSVLMMASPDDILLIKEITSRFDVTVEQPGGQGQTLPIIIRNCLSEIEILQKEGPADEVFALVYNL